ncbi:hypothetical protein SALBM135S_05781 [Streptomyces alboniger]
MPLVRRRVGVDAVAGVVAVAAPQHTDGARGVDGDPHVVQGFAGSPAYAAAKHAVVGLTKTAAVEYASRGVRVNAVAPGFIDTPLLRGDDAQREQLVALHPQGRLGTAEEVAELTLFLLSDRASFVNGSYHLVDGAYAAR